MATLLEGKKIAQHLKDLMKAEIEGLRQAHGRAPVLASVQVGRSAASIVYIKSQEKVAGEVGIEYRLFSFPEHISQEDLLSEVSLLNRDPGIHGIILQAPLPQGLSANDILPGISAAKDAEGMHPENLGKVLLGRPSVVPCTAEACMELLRSSQVKLYGKEAVVVGHSDIVGKPLSLMLLREFATTTVCHIATSETGLLEGHVKGADILVVAVGKAHLIKGDWIKPGAVVIDVGINRVGDRIVGDVEFGAADKRASFITPVPGGVGPLTVTMLMKNTLTLFKQALHGL